MGFLNRVNVFSSAYDERWRNYDVYDVIITLKPETGVIYLRVGGLRKISPSFQLNVRVFYYNVTE